MSYDYMSDWTEEERAAVQALGLPPNVAVGYVASRRGTNVTAVHRGYESIADQLNDLMDKKAGKGQISEDELREAFEKFSASMPPREQDDSA